MTSNNNPITTQHLKITSTKLYSCITIIKSTTNIQPTITTQQQKKFLPSLSNTNKTLLLPNIIFTTRCGRLPHITPDAWTHMLHEIKTWKNNPNNQIISLSIPYHTIEPYIPILTTSGNESVTDLFDFFSLERDEIFSIVTYRDTTLSARGILPTIPFIPSTTWSTVGTDMWIIPGDAIHLDSGSNRSKLALTNTLTSYQNYTTPVGFIPIIGNDEYDIKECIQGILSVQPSLVTGIAIDIPSKLLTQTTLKLLTQHQSLKNNPTLVFGGCAGLADIIEWFKHGIQLVETTFPETMSRLGLAIDLNINTPSTSIQNLFHQQDDAPKIDIRSLGEKESTPLVDGCRCFACVYHTRGYIRHLFIAHEMLGECLLMTHNVFMMVWFCNWLRNHPETYT
jgi:hypothetical protein